MSYFSILKTAASIVILSIGFTACQTSAESSEVLPSLAQKQSPLILEYKKGQVFSIVSFDSKEGEAAKSAVKEYFATAFPLAAQYGLERDGQLRVQAVPFGNHEAEGVSFVSWPSQEAEERLQLEPDWPKIKTLRPKAWDELRVYTDVLEEDLVLTFKPNKTYTMAVAWINPQNPTHYDIYMEGIKEAVAESGGRFMYKMFDPKFESHALKSGAPGQVTLVEWDSPQGLQNFVKIEDFKTYQSYFSTGVTRFESLALKTSG